MPGSSAANTIQNFVQGPDPNLPAWATPPAGSPAALPSWARPVPGAKAQARAAKQPQFGPPAPPVSQLTPPAKTGQQTRAQAQAAQAAARKQSQLLAGATSGALVGTTNTISDTISDTATNVNNWVASWKTPGGIGLLLLVIFVLIWAIIPVNGQYTRLHLMYLTITGRTHLQGSVVQQNAETVAMIADIANPTNPLSASATQTQGTMQDFSSTPSFTGS